MKKDYLKGALASIILTSCSSIDQNQLNNSILLTEDTHFENGFKLMTTSTENNRDLSGILDYNHRAKDEPSWNMAQWWSHQDFIHADYQNLEDGTHQYCNDSRTLLVNTKEGSLTMELNSMVEYQNLYGHSRDGSENWSHFLIEQDFKNALKLKDCKNIFIKLDFVINDVINEDEYQQIPAAQFLWYFTITDVKNGDSHYQSGNNDNDFFWFGIPLFDNRMDFVENYYHVDSGFVGSTNKLIYSISSRNYLKEKIQYGKKYHIEIDILPFIKEAYLYGIDNGAMEKSNYEDLMINYMNLGWELPGSFHVSSTISNLEVIAILKEVKQ